MNKGLDREYCTVAVLIEMYIWSTRDETTLAPRWLAVGVLQHYCRITEYYGRVVSPRPLVQYSPSS
jgi:hypothetical protein